MYSARTHYQGLYTGKWEIGIMPYDGIDFSRACYMFSGQGSSIPGMFHSAYRQIDVIRRRFDEADDLALSVDLPPPSLYLTNSQVIPNKHLDITRNLATYTVQVALFDHLLTCRTPPVLLTGSSQGEYAALVCSGAIDFATMFEVNIARHKICGQPNSLGYLMAVAASPTSITDMLSAYDIYISIVNCPERSVIAIPSDKLDLVKDVLHQKGIGAKLLEISHPYHSPLMQLAAKQFHSWLEKYGLQFQMPQIEVLSSVTHTFITSPMASIEAVKLISRQLTEPVDFLSQIELAYLKRCFAFLEVGPGATLSHSVQKTLRAQEHKILDIYNYQPKISDSEFPKVKLDNAQTKIFDAVKKAVAKITGYEIESITIEDRFQEDLAIDSLKKIEVIVEVIQEIDPERKDLGELPAAHRVADIVRIFSIPTDPEGFKDEPLDAGHFERFVVMMRDAPITANVASFSARWEVVYLKAMIDKEFKLTNGLNKAGLLLVAELNDFLPLTVENRNSIPNFEPLLDLFHSFQLFSPWLESNDFDLVLATSDESHPFALGLSSFFKSLMHEQPRLGFKHLHFSTMPSQTELLQIANTERANSYPIDIYYNNGRRQIAYYHEPLREANTVDPVLNNAIIVAFGGAKGISHALLTQLTAACQPHLYLAGRSSEEEVADALKILTQHNPHVQYTSLNALNSIAVENLLTEIHKKHGHIDFVINAVGIEKSNLLANKSRTEMREELSAKVTSAVNILNAAQYVSAGLTVNFVSVASRWGNAGQTVYACANEIVSQISMSYNRKLNRIGVISIEWPPWDGVGMTADPTVLFHLQRRGLFLLSPNRAAELLSGDLHRPQHDVVVYMDRTDMQLISTSTIDQRSNCGLVGKRSTESAYLRVLDQKHDLWLNDHIIDGIIYLPAAAAISMAFALSPYNNTELQCIEDFQILQPVVVRETPISLFLELEKKGSMIGMLGKTSVIHFRCYFREQAISNTLSYTSSKAERIINADTVYHDGLLFHGPTFQVLHQLLVLEDGKLEARIDSSRLNAIYGIDHWDRLTQWIDGAFQLLALAALLNQSVMAIPVGIRRILITKPQVKIASIKVSIKTLLISDGYVTGDVILREEGATPILILEGVKLKILRSVSIKNTSSLRLLSM